MAVVKSSDGSICYSTPIEAILLKVLVPQDVITHTWVLRNTIIHLFYP